MITTLTRALGAFAIATGLASAAIAQATPPSYSAQALHILPDGTVNAGTVVKSGPDMRLEYEENGRQVIQIIRRAEGLMYLLDPAQRTYTEFRGEPSPDPTGVGYLAPCQEGDPSVTCTKTGTEVTSGITAEVWEIQMQGQQTPSILLWDGARHRALKQTSPDGSMMTTAFQAMVNIAGRTVEHWAVTYEMPGQPTQTGAWYYDPELRVEIREELPGGAVRELADIRVGPVDPAMFTVPAGWQMVQAPQAPVPPGAAPMPGTGN